MASVGTESFERLDDSADYVASLERRLRKMNGPAPRSASKSASRAAAQSMLSSLAATRQDHMHHFLSADSANPTAGSSGGGGGAVLASFQPQSDNLGIEVAGEPDRDLGCCACCFPVYKMVFPSKVSVSSTERRHLVDSDELQLQYEQGNAEDSDSSG
ncbi:uncharacterized protein LOC135804409 [Sycon ciliatum]|uniref:uncharacterized protein LOC135804409 n=1 Tax=Sycon ciliatum TaxID=27933 RepID=UPI0020AC20EF|eukprot:scpid64806/ scgid34305/ 